MRILILGSGAREHAIALSLAGEDAGHEVFVAPGNAGIAEVATLVDLNPVDGTAVAEYADDADIDLVVIGPEAPLVAGVADVLRARGVPTFGPGRAAAELEGSKAFAKRVMEATGVPTGRATRAHTADEVAAALDEYGPPYVVKADGLAAGKGVIVTTHRDEAAAHAGAHLADGPVLVEEYLSGPEVSLFFVSDGDHVLPLSPAQDYKRVRDGDEGPNTGGMGEYSPLPWLAGAFRGEDAFVELVTRTIAEPVIRRMDAEGTPFIGLLYAGLVLTEQGVKVIEFNARFGDPETQVVLARLVTPLSSLLFAAATGTLEDEPAPAFAETAAVTVVLASEGYPDAAVTGRPIEGVEAAAELEGVDLLHAATARRDGVLVATGGRVLNAVAVGSTFFEARERAYGALARLTLEGSHHRGDIAAGVVEHHPD